jgi:hypothetical protein
MPPLDHDHTLHEVSLGSRSVLGPLVQLGRGKVARLAAVQGDALPRNTGCERDLLLVGLCDVADEQVPVRRLVLAVVAVERGLFNNCRKVRFRNAPVVRIGFDVDNLRGAPLARARRPRGLPDHRDARVSHAGVKRDAGKLLALERAHWAFVDLNKRMALVAVKSISRS